MWRYIYLYINNLQLPKYQINYLFILYYYWSAWNNLKPTKSAWRRIEYIIVQYSIVQYCRALRCTLLNPLRDIYIYIYICTHYTPELKILTICFLLKKHNLFHNGMVIEIILNRTNGRGQYLGSPLGLERMWQIKDKLRGISNCCIDRTLWVGQ